MLTMENWQRAFILHRRVYRESSLILEVFSEETGRIVLLAKGARRPRSPLKGLLQPFTPLLLRWTGKGEMKTLTRAESASITLPLYAEALYSGFYINELILRLIEKHTAYPALFQDYLHCLTALARREQHLEIPLRQFEFRLLRHLGYGIDFCHCIGTGKPVEAQMTYRYREAQGFIASLAKDTLTFYGRELLAFEAGDFQDPQIRLSAKRFARHILKHYLGATPLKSRELFHQALLGQGRLKIR